jgi:thiamine biosynthesis lipoprotein
MIRLALLLTFSLLGGCFGGDSLESVSGPTMGSRYTVQYVRESRGPAPEVVQAQVQGVLDEVDRQMSTYRADSDIERFNRLPANHCQAMPDSVLKLVRVGEQLSEQSQGAYDLTVEPLMDLWGFGPQAREEKVPSAQALAETRQRVGYRHLHIEGQQLCKDASVEVDFNSIAAGYAVDLIAERLASLGVRNYLAEATGELKAVGHKPDGSPWRVAIEVPRDDRQQAQQVLALDGYGVSTSGDYRNYFMQDGKRYSHTFDARTGAPITHALAEVTVIHPSTLMADGLSTMLLVLGPDEGPAYAERHDIAALFVTRADNVFVTHGSTAFQRMARAAKVAD